MLQISVQNSTSVYRGISHFESCHNVSEGQWFILHFCYSSQWSHHIPCDTVTCCTLIKMPQLWEERKWRKIVWHCVWSTVQKLNQYFCNLEQSMFYLGQIQKQIFFRKNIFEFNFLQKNDFHTLCCNINSKKNV